MTPPNQSAARAAILVKAHAHRFSGRLANPTRSASARNTSCGDEITVEIQIESESENGIEKIVNAAAEVRACLVSEAAWTIAAEAVLGLTIVEAEAEIRSALFSLQMQNDGQPIGAKWELLKSFRRPHPRQRCASLPLEVLLRCLQPYVEN